MARVEAVIYGEIRRARQGLNGGVAHWWLVGKRKRRCVAVNFGREEEEKKKRGGAVRVWEEEEEEKAGEEKKKRRGF